MGKILTEILNIDIQKKLIDEIQKDLHCPTDPDNILCSEKAADISLFIGQNVTCTHEEVNNICENTDKACQKPWTKDSCVDDTKAILYPHWADREIQKRYLNELIEKYSDEIHDELQLLGEDKTLWEKDMKQFVEIFDQMADHLGPEILCANIYPN